MKKVFKTIALIVVMFTALLGNANEGLTFIEKKDRAKTILMLDYVKEGQQLYIKDLNGFILYKELIKDSGNYSKGFDLTALPDGNYVFELDTDVEIKTIPFKVAANAVVFDKEGETNFFKPVAFKKGDLIYISRLSFGKKPLELKIYFKENGDLVTSEKFKNVQIAEKIYDFSNAEKGTYKIVFKTEGRVFIQNVKV